MSQYKSTIEQLSMNRGRRTEFQRLRAKVFTNGSIGYKMLSHRMGAEDKDAEK
jgi:hypothetical protein